MPGPGSAAIGGRLQVCVFQAAQSGPAARANSLSTPQTVVQRPCSWSRGQVAGRRVTVFSQVRIFCVNRRCGPRWPAVSLSSSFCSSCSAGVGFGHRWTFQRDLSDSCSHAQVGHGSSRCPRVTASTLSEESAIWYFPECVFTPPVLSLVIWVCKGHRFL